jgi:hypothetical protein
MRTWTPTLPLRVLAGSELHEGVEFADHPRVAELVARPGTARLFPGEGAIAPDAFERPPETLPVTDGTADGVPTAPGRAGRVLPALGEFIQGLLAENLAAQAKPI